VDLIGEHYLALELDCVVLHSACIGVLRLDVLGPKPALLTGLALAVSSVCEGLLNSIWMRYSSSFIKRVLFGQLCPCEAPSRPISSYSTDQTLQRSGVDCSRTAGPTSTRSTLLMLLMLPIDLSAFAGPFIAAYLLVALAEFKSLEYAILLWRVVFASHIRRVITRQRVGGIE